MLTNAPLKFQIDALWMRFWNGGIKNPLNAIEQVSYIIFLKRLKDTEFDAAYRASRECTTRISPVTDSLKSELPLEEVLMSDQIEWQAFDTPFSKDTYTADRTQFLRTVHNVFMQRPRPKYCLLLSLLIQLIKI